MKPRYALGTATLMIGSALNYFGDRLLGVSLELYRGLVDKFSATSMLDVFLVPFIVGLFVALMFGRGGKWLCYFPPLIVRTVSYANFFFADGLPEGSRLIPIGWWGFFVILAVEASAIGGVLGEVMVKRTYGRSPAGTYVAKGAAAQAKPAPDRTPET